MILIRVFFVIFLSLYLTAASPVYGADFLSQVHPNIGVQEEYTDNLQLTNENKINDFITTVQPGLKYSNMDATSGIDLDALFGFVFYDKNPNLNYIGSNDILRAKYLTTEHLNFYIQDSFIRSNSPRELEYFTTAATNEYLLATQTQRAVYWRNVVEPKIEYQFGDENSVGVIYRNNVYQTESSISENSIENYVQPYIYYWLNKQNGIYLEYDYDNGVFQSSPDLNGQRIDARYINRFIPRASAFIEYIFSDRSFSSSELNYNINEGDVGLTYTFSSTLKGSAQVGYYWMTPKIGSGQNGITFKGDLSSTDKQTAYSVGIQGGYIEDYFTSQNLGFQQYYRATGSITHFLDRRLSIGLLGSIERVPGSNSTPVPSQRYTILGAGANLSYLPLKWLKISLEYHYSQNTSNYYYEESDYMENKAMLTVTATY
ncbi:MAG TPA: hypothetical protein VMU29_09415 [Smithella sp.]|nr:hypothetical protein [Smithella sp.]